MRPSSEDNMEISGRRVVRALTVPDTTQAKEHHLRDYDLYSAEKGVVWLLRCLRGS